MIMALIVGFMTLNLYITIITGRLIGLIPISIQGVLLGLIMTKNQYAKIGIKIWAIVFFVVASGLQFVGRLLQDAVDNFSNANALHYLTTGFEVIVGILIVLYVNKTVEVIEIEK